MQPTDQTITACGQTRSLLVYNVRVECFEHAIETLLHPKNKSEIKGRFMLQLDRGTVKVTRRVEMILDSEFDVVVAGRPLEGTAIDLGRQNIFISATDGQAQVCLMDLKLSQGYSQSGGTVRVFSHSID